MGLHLSSRDVERYREATEVLLSPLDYDGVATWCAAVLERVERLFQADRAILVLPVQGRASSHIHSTSSGGLMRGRQAVGHDVWHNEALAEAAGVSLDSIPFYRGAMAPNGAAYGSGMDPALPPGEAWLSVAYSRPANNPFGVEGGLELLRMLHPAFSVGVRCLADSAGRREAIAHTFDSFGEAVMACDLNGHERYRSATLHRILEEEPEANRLLAEVHDLAATVARRRRSPSGNVAASVGCAGQRVVTTPRTRYALSAALVSADSFGLGGAVLVRLQEEGLTLPSATDLMDRYELTPRQAEIALLLAKGASNREVARRLYISPHTVRTHAEQIFRKLGIHSRKALALELHSGRPPQSRSTAMPRTG